MNEPRENRDTLTDEALQQLLQGLPREQASQDFKAGVLARIESDRQPEPSRLLEFRPAGRRLPVWSGVLVAAAALLLCGLGLREWQHQREIEESMRRIAELRGQYQELASELASLRQEAASSRPVVYMGGNRQVDLVLDLGRIAAAQKDPQAVDPEARRQARQELERLSKEGSGSPLY